MNKKIDYEFMNHINSIIKPKNGIANIVDDEKMSRTEALCYVVGLILCIVFAGILEGM